MARRVLLAAKYHVAWPGCLLHVWVGHRWVELESAVHQLANQMARLAEPSRNLLAASFVAEHHGSAVVLQGCRWHNVGCLYHCGTAAQAAPPLEAGTLH